jgi:tRNA modification GTPase
MTNPQDTICAIATPNGIGAISVIRVSGKDTLAKVSTVFSKNLTDKESHTVHFGNFKSLDQELIDEVLVTIFHHGRSFTGEESAEIACHASPYVQQQILQALLSIGCRLAEPGEFTMRAFMNGKLDLSQAEAVADLIASQSKNAHTIALNQLRGDFSSKLKDLREQLIHFASLVELELDFAEEDVEFADRTELKALVSDVLIHIRKLIGSFELGNAIKNGVPVAIVGAPNTGKSTLLNQLLGEERAIVSNIAGTTRDVIEETLNIEGILFRLIDTAGIREGAEDIEAIGIERSREKIRMSKIVLCMADLTVDGNIEAVVKWAKEIAQMFPEKKVIVAGNKSDISQKTIENCDLPSVLLSAKHGSHLDELKKILVESVIGDIDLGNDTIVSNTRHLEALVRTEETLSKALEGLNTGVTGDFVAMDIRQAMFHLGSITGDISTDDLLGNIFARFCIGK